MYTTKHAQKLFDVKSDQTIRNWVKEFAEFFSIDAMPGKGVDLQFSEEDMKVFDLIASMRTERRSSDEIYATLKSGQRGKSPEYTPEELDLLVGGDYEKYLSTQLNELTLKIDQLTRENEELRTAIQPVREQSIRLEAEKAALDKRIVELNTELHDERKRNEMLMERYLREIAELRYKMGQMEKRNSNEE
jgi:predicted RNase H-like nuclease (RuvC/YqgF family)